MRNKLLCKVSAAERGSFKRLIKDAAPVLQLIDKCCIEDFDKADKISDEDFKNPNWAIEQAYKLGLKRGLTKLREYVIIEL